MKQWKLMEPLNDFPTRTKRKLREVNFRIAVTLILCSSMAFLALFLVMFINLRLRKLIVSDDLYFPPLITSFSPSSPPPPSSPTSDHFSCNSPSPPSLLNSSKINNGGSVGDWIAPTELWHSMTDEELMWRASMAPGIRKFPYNRTPKVAFMFLTRGRLPLAPLWEKFFEGHEGFFSIYIHTSQEFTGEPPESSFFYKRRIPSKAVQWGRATMIDAERRLLANALLDFSNERFVLLSETCVPLFNFTTTYDYLVGSNLSFLGSFDDPRRTGRGRYNKRMAPPISMSDWRKGSQWFEANRNLATRIVSDVRYYPIFRTHCRPPCYMDEHYLPTLVAKICPELTSNRTVTWADWSEGGSHPARFVGKDVTEAFLNRVRHGFNNCSYNGGVSPVCFLFARKFHPSTLQPLMRMAHRVLGFNP